MLNTETYIIERGIAIPDRPSGPGAPVKYKFFDRMSDGDSILIPTKRDALRVFNAGKKRGFKMTLRTVNDGFRVWLLSK